ncbi:hypothetical protein XAC3810_230054 [Xanthomonas citri pv. citri]|uniref:Uncharacterized protein n=1 Tax=Xanthomonas citri pv. citri TaxID=611301 RepID=A0A0U5FAV5_XANCI|nr:hypothetical protein XAC9322_210054 [Xanthomonas citri pv. citri]CEE20811.1 hypothetical protein XAC1083_210054 [Xanthomonas citri pv. citri]CEE29159.1 hypothetical protein XAC3810_230054 [Xanthomonas citri pv. citri]CEE35367.1 hypothetical protein XAC908_320052 [Xanthomonas citri pv. citri]CEE58582.1 hypothetical protein XACW160_250054 [Xanthomonas citri pv. citri]
MGLAVDGPTLSRGRESDEDSAIGRCGRRRRFAPSHRSETFSLCRAPPSADGPGQSSWGDARGAAVVALEQRVVERMGAKDAIAAWHARFPPPIASRARNPAKQARAR